MSIRYHRKSATAPHTCLHDCEPWPCDRIQQFDQDCGEILAQVGSAAGGGSYAGIVLTALEKAIRTISPME